MPSPATSIPTCMTPLNRSRAYLIVLLLLALAPLQGSVLSHALLTDTVSLHTSGTMQSAPPPSEPAQWIGVSSYPRTLSGQYSTAIIDDIITYMDAEGLTIYRMSIWYSVDPTPWVQYYLEHCAYDLIVCRHMYPMAALSASEWTAVQTWTLTLLAECSSYQDRLWVEPINERTNSDLASRLQTLVTAVRDAGYTARIIANKWEQSWNSMATIHDPLDRFWTGYHYYFTNGAWSSAEQQLQTAMNLGLKLLNTEVGADYNEHAAFDPSEVTRLNTFLAWCAERDIGNTVWMCYGLQNLPRYQELGLQYPIE
jgi:hypothetical protein